MKISHSRILIDICNTIADVSKAIEGVFGPVPEPLLFSHPKTPRIFWERENRIARKIFETAEPFEGAAEVLNQLSKHYEILYLTARPQWAKKLTYNWLERHGFPAGEIVFTRDKYSWIKENGGLVMFEDDPRHIKIIQTLIPVLVHARPWNKGFESRFEWGEELIIDRHCFYRKNTAGGIRKQV